MARPLPAARDHHHERLRRRHVVRVRPRPHPRPGHAIQGSLDRLLASVLPHEVTHTVFAYYFRQPVPRWADEGGAVLSEDDIERNRHDQLVRQILNTPGRAIPLRRLFAMTKYPPDVMVLYAEGYSVSISRGGQQPRRLPEFRGPGDARRLGRGGEGELRLWQRGRVGKGLGGKPVPLASAGAADEPPGRAGRRRRGGSRRDAADGAAGPPLLEAPRAIVRGQAPDAAYDGAMPKKDQWWLPNPPGSAPSAVVPASAPLPSLPPRVGEGGVGGQPADSSPTAPAPVRLGPPRGDVPPPPPRFGQPIAAGGNGP